MINISWIIDLIDNIPYILSFIIPGYIFLSTYYWVSFVDSKNFNNLVIKSVAASYILGVVFDFILKKIKIIILPDQRIILLTIIGLLLGVNQRDIFQHVPITSRKPVKPDSKGVPGDYALIFL